MPLLRPLTGLAAWVKGTTVLQKAVILAIIMGIFFTVSILTLQARSERFSSLYIYPESYNSYPTGNSTNFTYGIRSYEKEVTGYDLKILVGNRLMNTTRHVLLPGETIERNVTLNITGITLPAKVQVTLASPYNTYAVHYWLKGILPVAAFTAEPTSGKEPLTVHFTDLSTNNPRTWRWTFGDGRTSSVRSPNHTYAAGTYLVTLRVTNSAGSDEETLNTPIEVYLRAPPVAGFSASPRKGYVPLLVNFTDETTNLTTSRFWDFGDGIFSTDQNPSHLYNYPGEYTVNLTVSNDDGTDEVSKAGYITTYYSVWPIAVFTANDTSGIEPHAVGFQDKSLSSPVRWAWDFGDGQRSSERNPTHVYLNGTFNVTLTVSNEEGTDSTTETNYITVFRKPVTRAP